MRQDKPGQDLEERGLVYKPPSTYHSRHLRKKKMQYKIKYKARHGETRRETSQKPKISQDNLKSCRLFLLSFFVFCESLVAHTKCYEVLTSAYLLSPRFDAFRVWVRNGSAR